MYNIKSNREAAIAAGGYSLKRKHENFIFLTIVLCSAAVLGFRAGGLKAEPAHREAMAFSNALFIGDSLMEGAYWYYDDAEKKHLILP